MEGIATGIGAAVLGVCITIAAAVLRNGNGLRRGVTREECTAWRAEVKSEIARVEQKIDALRQLTEAGFDTLRAELGRRRK